MNPLNHPYRLALAFAVVSSAYGQIQAQDAPIADVAVGYSHTQVVKGSSLTANGAGGSGALSINNWLGVAGDFALYQSAPVGSGVDAGTYTFGPRVSYRRWNRLTPFAQLLVGGVRYTKNAFVWGDGAGMDIRLDQGGRYALRPQVDYLDFRPTTNAMQTVRYSLSIVFRIRRR